MPIDDPESGFIRERANLLASEAHRTPLPVLIIGAIVAYTYWKLTGAFLKPFVWWLIIFVFVFGRYACALRYIKRKISAIQLEKAYTQFAVANALLMGLGFALSMREFPTEWQAIVTMFGVCLVAATIPGSALSSRIFAAFSFPGLGLMAVGWWLWGRLQPIWLDWIFGGLLCLFAYMAYAFVKQSESKAREAYRTRTENHRLVAQLRENQGELISQRDLAEQANLAKSRFLAAASHDLRQPLHTITLFNATLALRPLDERSAWLVKQTHDAVVGLSSLLNSLLDLSRLDSQNTELELQAVDLQALLTQIIAGYAPQAQQNGVTIEFDGNLAFAVRSDPIFLERVLRNLIDNALKHGARQMIRIELKRDHTQQTEISVIDDGPGIPAHLHAHVFEEFFQINNESRNRNKGIGLGLAIVKRLCQQLSINCTLKSSESGSTFNLAFPAAQATQIQLHGVSPASDRTVNPVSHRVLVIDNELAVGLSTEALLTAWGFDVVLVTSSNIANAQLASEKWYAVLISDCLESNLGDGVLTDPIQSNDRVYGVALLDANRDQLKRTLCCLMSGNTTGELRRQCEIKGYAYFSKPIDPERLRRHLEV